MGTLEHISITTLHPEYIQDDRDGSWDFLPMGFAPNSILYGTYISAFQLPSASIDWTCKGACVECEPDRVGGKLAVGLIFFEEIFIERKKEILSAHPRYRIESSSFGQPPALPEGAEDAEDEKKEDLDSDERIEELFSGGMYRDLQINLKRQSYKILQFDLKHLYITNSDFIHPEENRCKLWFESYFVLKGCQLNWASIVQDEVDLAWETFSLFLYIFQDADGEWYYCDKNGFDFLQRDEGMRLEEIQNIAVIIKDPCSYADDNDIWTTQAYINANKLRSHLRREITSIIPIVTSDDDRIMNVVFFDDQMYGEADEVDRFSFSPRLDLPTVRRYQDASHPIFSMIFPADSVQDHQINAISFRYANRFTDEVLARFEQLDRRDEARGGDPLQAQDPEAIAPNPGIHFVYPWEEHPFLFATLILLPILLIRLYKSSAKPSIQSDFFFDEGKVKEKEEGKEKEKVE